MLIFGVVLILAILFMPNGILGLAQQALGGKTREEVDVHLLEGEGVSKHFGGLAAVSEVDFYVDEGEILGLIGPNGAGKTTLFNLISARSQAEAGQDHVQGHGHHAAAGLQDLPAGHRPDVPDGQDLPERPRRAERHGRRAVRHGQPCQLARGPEEGGGGPRVRRSAAASRTFRPATSPWPSRSVSRWPGLSPAIPNCSCSTN